MDTIVSFDFPPAVGGAHLWLYEVYRRWPEPVAVLTSRAAPTASLSAGGSAAPEIDGSLRIWRDAAPIGDINLASLGFLQRGIELGRRVAALAADPPRGTRRIHALRAFPEGVIAAVGRRLAGARSTSLITYAHGEELIVAESSRQLALLARWAYSSSDLVIANSVNTQRLVRSMCPRARVEVVHPGVPMRAAGCGRASTGETISSYWFRCRGWSRARTRRP